MNRTGRSNRAEVEGGAIFGACFHGPDSSAKRSVQGLIEHVSNVIDHDRIRA